MSEIAVSNEMGKTLIEEARRLIKSRLTEQCVGEVETVMQHITRVETNIARETNRLKIYKARLQAIEDGAISVTRRYDGNVVIVYNNAELNEDNSETKMFREHTGGNAGL